VTALGMAARGGGWGLAPDGQSLLLIVGGIARKPAVVDERVEPRDLLDLTVAFDNTSIASFSKRRSRSTRSRRRFACTWVAASLAACLIVCLPITAPPSHRQRLHSPMDFQLAERSPFRLSRSADSNRKHFPMILKPTDPSSASSAASA
jgi:hypothetical protein